jgi:Na+-driven multidrug efflux pump
VFNPEPELIEWAETYIKLMALAFLFTPINVVISQSMVSRNRLRIPVVTDTVILLGILTPTLIIAALAGATPRTLIILNGAAVIALTLAYVIIRQVVLKLPLVPWKGR